MNDVKIFLNKVLSGFIKDTRIFKIIFYFILLYVFLKVIVINVTPSIQTGIYLRIPKTSFKKGDIIRVDVKYDNLPEYAKKEYEKTKAFKNNVMKKIKIIAGTEGDVITIKNDYIFVNNINYGKIYDLKRLNIPDIKDKLNGYTLKKDEIIALSKRDKSFDGRYDGVININKIHSKYILLLKSPFDLGYCFEENNKSKKCILAKRVL